MVVFGSPQPARYCGYHLDRIRKHPDFSYQCCLVSLESETEERYVNLRIYAGLSSIKVLAQTSTVQQGPEVIPKKCSIADLFCSRSPSSRYRVFDPV